MSNKGHCLVNVMGVVWVEFVIFQYPVLFVMNNQSVDVIQRKFGGRKINKEYGGNV